MQYLVIVARDQPDLFEHLKRRLAEDSKVEVMFDRRRGERRRLMQKPEHERRRDDRRRQPSARPASFQPVNIARVREGRAFLRDVPPVAPPGRMAGAPVPGPAPSTVEDAGVPDAEAGEAAPSVPALRRPPAAAAVTPTPVTAAVSPTQQLLRWAGAGPMVLDDLTDVVRRCRAIAQRCRDEEHAWETALKEVAAVGRENARLIAERLEIRDALAALTRGAGDRVSETINVVRAIEQSGIIRAEPSPVDFGRSFLVGRLRQTSEAMLHTIQDVRRRLSALERAPVAAAHEGRRPDDRAEGA